LIDSEREETPPKPETSTSNKDDENSEDAPNASTATDKGASRRVNPHKYLLYKPAFSQLMVYIATAFKVGSTATELFLVGNRKVCLLFFPQPQEINDNSALLVYLSADGAKKPENEPEDETPRATQERFNSPLPGLCG
jgi:hypothetical protein